MPPMGYGADFALSHWHPKSGKGFAVLVSPLDVMMEIIGHPVVVLTLPVPLPLFDGASDWSPAKT